MDERSRRKVCCTDCFVISGVTLFLHCRYKTGQNHLTDFIGVEPSKKRKRRTSFTPQALELLNAHFERNTHPSGTMINIKTFFQICWQKFRKFSRNGFLTKCAHLSVNALFFNCLNKLFEKLAFKP